MFRPTFVSCLAVAMFAGCVTDADQAIDVTGEPADVFVFGLSADEVLAAKRVAQRPMSDEAWLEAHRGAFSCERYGDLCKKVGPVAAARAIELGYRRAIEGADHTEVVRAQQEAVAAARPAWRELAVTTYNSDTQISYGTGGSGRRLLSTAFANYLWPALVLETDAECVTQKDIFGWWQSDVERICGSMRGDYNHGDEVIHRDRTCVTNAGVKSFTAHVEVAATLTTSVNCHAEDGLWEATRFSDVTITP